MRSKFEQSFAVSILIDLAAFADIVEVTRKVRSMVRPMLYIHRES